MWEKLQQKEQVKPKVGDILKRKGYENNQEYVLIVNDFSSNTKTYGLILFNSCNRTILRSGFATIKELIESLVGSWMLDGVTVAVKPRPQVGHMTKLRDPEGEEFEVRYVTYKYVKTDVRLVDADGYICNATFSTVNDICNADEYKNYFLNDTQIEALLFNWKDWEVWIKDE